MRIVILGAPGAGKGTQAEILSDKFKIPHISTGDIFRENIEKSTALGSMAKEYIDNGLLVPDEITIKVIEERLKCNDCKKGFILDGFPRTILQAEALDRILAANGIALDIVLNIFVDDSEIVKRLSGRRICKKCGKTYHVLYNPPSIDGKCDNCGGEIIQRDDDKEETVISRLKTYHSQTEPLLDYYRKNDLIVTVFGQEKIEDTTKEVLRVLNKKGITLSRKLR